LEGNGIETFTLGDTTDLTIKCATHSRSNGGRKIRGQACPKPTPTGFHAFHGPDFLPRQVRLCVPEFMARSDTIRVELDLRDESGVSTVSAAFYELNTGKGFMMRGESDGEREVTVALAQKVTNEILPGEYRCEGVTVYDVHLNRKTFHPDIRFRVVNIPGDHEGPELFGWRVSKE
jgi:hypothetical protein